MCIKMDKFGGVKLTHTHPSFFTWRLQNQGGKPTNQTKRRARIFKELKLPLKAQHHKTEAVGSQALGAPWGLDGDGQTFGEGLRASNTDIIRHTKYPPPLPKSLPASSHEEPPRPEK